MRPVRAASWLLAVLSAAACASAPERTQTTVNVRLMVVPPRTTVVVQPPPTTVVVASPGAVTEAGGANGAVGFVPGAVNGATPAATTVALPPSGASCRGADGAAPVVQQLALGPGRSCALLADHSVCCWGRREAHAGDDSPRPARLQGLSDVRSLGLGGDHGCALLGDHTVWCWGRDTYGELGDGGTQDRASPAAVPGLQNVAALAVGQWHSCVLGADGGVRCWGGNLRNRATGAGPDVLVPRRIEGLEGVRSLHLGVDSYAILANGTFRAFGTALLYTYAPPDRLDYTFFTLRSQERLTEIAVAYGETTPGDLSVCSLRRDGAVWCWGGPYSPHGDARRMVARAMPRLNDVTALRAGAGHYCALRRDGSVWCWGSNGSGQVGDGTTTEATAPVQVAGLTDVVEIAATEGHSCARRASGEVRCWGRGDHGQLGDGASVDRATPAVVQW